MPPITLASVVVVLEEVGESAGRERTLRRRRQGHNGCRRADGLLHGGVSRLAGLYSLVATCESRGINPFDYLSDVLARVQDHPARAVAELLPGAWAAAGA